MSHGSFEIRGGHVLAAILAFFALIIAVNVTFAIYAVRSFPGEDVRRSYLQGLGYNDTLAERRAQAAIGWRASAALSEGALVVDLHDRLGAPIDGATVVGTLRWPTDARLDRALIFEPLGDGRYRAAVPDLTPGRWELRARAEDGAGALDFEAELTWPMQR